MKNQTVIDSALKSVKTGMEKVSEAAEVLIECFVENIDHIIELYEQIPSHKVPHEDAVKAIERLQTVMGVHSTPTRVANGYTRTNKTRQQRKQEILAILRANPNGLTRKELASKFNVGEPTITNVVEGLVKDEYLYKTTELTASRGRAAFVYHVN